MGLDESLRKKIIKVLREHNVESASIFGSYARGEATEESDIDLLVELRKKSLFELAAIKNDIEEATGLKVDINTYNGLKYSTRDDLREKVLAEQEKIIWVNEEI